MLNCSFGNPQLRKQSYFQVGLRTEGLDNRSGCQAKGVVGSPHRANQNGQFELAEVFHSAGISQE